MLQKSRSKTVSKLKYLILLPLLVAMLTYVSCSEDQGVIPEEVETITVKSYNSIKVGDVLHQNSEEKKLVEEAMARLESGKIDMVEITDGKTKRVFTLDPQSLEPKMEIVSQKSTRPSGKQSQGVPVEVIEQVPVFPGCEGLATNDLTRDCLANKITEHVNRNFNTRIGKEMGLTGTNRIYVQFTIDHDGEVSVLGARASDPKLAEEAKRVVNGLPKMIPGKQTGKTVRVLYSLPITFRVNG